MNNSLSKCPLLIVMNGLLLLLASCNDNRKEQPMFTLLKNSGIRFTNMVKDEETENSFLFRNYYNGGGVAIGDLNNDGFPDVFLTSNKSENKLYLNKGNFKFEDITSHAGLKQDSLWNTGVTFVDINNDGWLDIYVCSSGHMTTGRRINKLYINNHDLTFTESAKKYGLNISGYSTHASFFDYDLDGDLDMFLINNSPITVNQLGYSNRRDLPDAQWPVAESLKGGGDHLYRNDNDFFTEVTKEAGIHGSLISFGLGVTVGDVNADGYPDVYIANDSYERDYLYLNQGNGTFKDEFEECIQHTSMSSMGADLADINNDGYQDIFTTDMLPEDDYRLKTLGAFDNIDLYKSREKAGFYHQFMQNCLQVNNGNGKFLETANYSGVDATDWSWGALLFDADNDGLNDIFVCNGVNRDVTNLDFMDFFANDVIQKMLVSGKKKNAEEIIREIPVNPVPNKMYRNTGNLKFSDAGESWGFMEKSFSNGAAYGDLDNDGDLDLVINNENQEAFVYRNEARQRTGNNYIGIVLKGKPKNGFAIGSMVKLYAGNQVICREMIPGRGFQSSVDYKLIIGLGSAITIDSMIITWPDRSASKFIQPVVNKVSIFDESVVEKYQPVFPDHKKNTSAEFLVPVDHSFDKHKEDDFVDFYYERNIPELLSREGPRAVVSDVNGDGLEDIFIGGAKDQGGQLYLQTSAGTFIKKAQEAFNQFKSFEDVSVLFFDCDQDKDPDLLICPGGNNAAPDTREIQLRLFKNDGHGNFQIDIEAFPVNEANTGAAAASDFDHDGDLDLFIGGRSVPRDYGVTPRSYLFVNNGSGHFTDMAKEKNKDISEIGMVTGAAWADINGDHQDELIIVGEWMAPRIFSFNGDRFTEIKSGLNELKGWWQTVQVADMNGDGKQDLLLGNIGENFYLQPDQTNPVKLWINDFDNNGTPDKILTRTVAGKDRTVFLKNELQDQIPSIKKENLKHGDYARKDMQQLFSRELIDKAEVKTFNYMHSCIAYNQGNGRFIIRNFPAAMQLSSVNAFFAADLNGDGKTDLLSGGNNFGFLPQLGRLDASFGNMLINDGGEKFTCSGLDVPGQVRDIVQVKGKGKTYVLFLRNDDLPLLFRLNSNAAKHTPVKDTADIVTH